MTHRVAFVLLDDFSLLGLAAASEPLFVANWLSGRELYRWRLLRAATGAAVSSSGVPVAVEPLAGSQAAEFDAVYVIASFSARLQARDAALGRLLGAAFRRGALVGGIETGSEALAAAGLLDGCRAAVHWANRDGFAAAWPRVALSPRRFEIDRRRVTCVGASAVLDLFVELVEQQQGAPLALELAEHLAHVRGDAARAPDPRAENAAAPQALTRAMTVMREHIERPLTLAAVARAAGLSQRQIERLFATRLGTTPHRFYRELRLGHARDLLQQTALPVTDVAVRCGFGSVEHFSRSYRQVHGCPPSADRIQSKHAPAPRLPIASPPR